MKKAFIVIALSFALVGCGGGTVTDQGSAPVVESSAPVAENKAENETENKAPALEDGVLGGKYKVEFAEGKKVDSSYDGECIEVTYTFTNNSDEAVAADTALMFTAYQDGVQIDSAFDSALTGDNESKSIKPGTTLECKRLFIISSDSDVEVEVKEFMGLDDSKVIKTYQLQ